MKYRLFAALAALCALAAVPVLDAAVLDPGGSGSIGTVNYISGNLALGTTVSGRGGSTTSSIDGQPVGETFGTVTSGGNDGAGKNAGFAAGDSWHIDSQSGTPVVPTFFRVDFGDLAAAPNAGSQEFAIGLIEVFGRRDCCGTQFNGSVDVERLDASISSTSPITGNSQTGPAPGSDFNAFTGLGSIGRTIDYSNMSSFQEIEANGLPNLTLGVGDVLEIEVGDMGNDFVFVEGAASLEGDLNIDFLAGSNANAHDVFDLLTAATIDTSLLTTSVTGLGGDYILQTVDGGNGQILQLVLTPEPASIALWAIIAGIFGCGFYVRRRRK